MMKGKKNIFAKLDWLVDLALEKAVNMPKTIIFCNMISEIIYIIIYIVFKKYKMFILCIKCNAVLYKKGKAKFLMQF